MPPKGKNNNNGSAKHGNGKQKKQAAEDEFEKFLADLSKTTQQVGKERTERMAKDEKVREEQRKKHTGVTKQQPTNDFESLLIKRQKSMHLQQLLAELLSAQRPFGRKPITDFRSETHTENANFSVAVGDMQGWRAQMEDNHLVDVAFPSAGTDSKEGFFGVFDGHSGVKSANLCSELFSQTVAKYATPAGANHHTIDFEAAFLDVDAQLRTSLGEGGSGCTAVTVYVSPEEVTCAWVGDSRAVLCRGGEAFDLSHDHKPDVEEEQARIEAAGGFVQHNRVNGQLAMSRAMGDFVYKKDAERGVSEQLVVPVPGVITTKRGADDTYVAIACDGIFDVLTNEELIAFINEEKEEGKANVDICKDLCERCLAPEAAEGGPAQAEGTDNMTIMIVDLN